MTRTMLKINNPSKPNPFGRISEEFVSDFNFDDFFNTFERFIQLKTLEGLSFRSLHDYKSHMKYFKKYLESAQRTTSIRCVEIDTFRSYLYYMVQEKQY